MIYAKKRFKQMVKEKVIIGMSIGIGLVIGILVAEYFCKN